MRELPHQGYFKNFRICPNCKGKFMVNSDTKIRQALLIPIALISLTFTILLYFNGSGWLSPALTSYVALILLILWGNSQVFLVPYNDEKDKDEEREKL
jgi:pilus assembly protein TadC